MKNKNIFFLITSVLVCIIITIIYYNHSNSDKNMNYKFENSKLFITVDSNKWIEVPFDFSYTIEHLNNDNNGKFKDNTYQMSNKKIVFYTEIKSDILQNENLSSDLKNNATQNYSLFMIYSDDKGKTWHKSLLGVSNSVDSLLYINFKDVNNGELILKGRNNAENYNYITNDGGQNWKNK